MRGRENKQFYMLRDLERREYWFSSAIEAAESAVAFRDWELFVCVGSTHRQIFSHIKLPHKLSILLTSNKREMQAAQSASDEDENL